MASDRRIRIEPGLIIKALEAHIQTLEDMPKDNNYGNRLWEIMRIKDQIEALTWRPTVSQVAGWGGNWLGIIRGWMQSNARNGSDVTWGSHEPLHVTSSLTPFNMEFLAARIAEAAINEHMGPWVPKRSEDGQ